MRFTHTGAICRSRPGWRDELPAQPGAMPSCFNEAVYFRFSLLSTDLSCRALVISALVLFATAFSGCKWHARKNSTSAGGAAPILLFNGTGTSLNDVQAIETILHKNNLSYSTVNSSRLNGMDESQIRKYRLLIVPGGNFIDIGNNLDAAVRANIRHAVQHGLNYLGVCAGGFFAGNSNYYNGLNLTSGVTFHFYSAENRGVRKAAVLITGPPGRTLDQYWQDGPQFSGWGAVAGRYPDGTPAIAEGTVGSGWVILAGVHAEAPEDWRHGMTFTTPASTDNAYAAVLIRAALNRVSLPHY